VFTIYVRKEILKILCKTIIFDVYIYSVRENRSSINRNLTVITYSHILVVDYHFGLHGLMTAADIAGLDWSTKQCAAFGHTKAVISDTNRQAFK